MLQTCVDLLLVHARLGYAQFHRVSDENLTGVNPASTTYVVYMIVGFSMDLYKKTCWLLPISHSSGCVNKRCTSSLLRFLFSNTSPGPFLDGDTDPLVHIIRTSFLVTCRL